MSDYDITGKIGPIYTRVSESEWPMYSYDRPAYILWNAIAGELDARGWTQEQIKTWLQSKEPRWSLDGDLGEIIAKIGRRYAENLAIEKGSKK